jgi:thymidylate kinase
LEYQKNADYYARIEVLDANKNIEKVKEQVLEYLSHTGEVRDISIRTITWLIL